MHLTVLSRKSSTGRDLSPIKSCWNWMKGYIGDEYGLGEKPSYDRAPLLVGLGRVFF